LRARTIKSKELDNDEFTFDEPVWKKILKLKNKYVYSSLLMNLYNINQTSAWRALDKLCRDGKLKDLGVQIIRRKSDGSRNRVHLFEKIGKK